MGSQKLFLIKTQFISMSRKMVSMIRVLWVSFLSSMITLFGLIGEHMSRLQEKFTYQTRNMNVNLESFRGLEDDQIGGNISEVDDESESFLRFQFRTFEEFVHDNDAQSTSGKIVCDNNSDDKGNLTNSQNQACYEKVSNTIAKPIEEITESQLCFGNTSPANGLAGDIFPKDEDIVCVDGMDLNEIGIENGEKLGRVDDNLMNNVHRFRQRTSFASDDESLVSDDSDSMICSSNSSFGSSYIDSFSDGLSEVDFERAFEIDTLMKYGFEDMKLANDSSTEDLELHNLSKDYYSDDDFEDEDEDLMQELNNLESDLEGHTHNLDKENGTTFNIGSLDEQNDVKGNLDSNLVDAHVISNTKIEVNLEINLHDVENPANRNIESNFIDDNETLGVEDRTKIESSSESEQNSEKSSSGEQLSSDSDDKNGLEREWEHQDFLEQLKMEIKKVRAIGLPTILEESEFPKVMDDLKPWKIEKKYKHEGAMDELQKFYKSYIEKMRKLDILNYQKMYAIGFLKLKDPLRSFAKNKTSYPAITSIVSVDCWPCKPKTSSEIHQPVMKKFSRELESDLEKVYVGQMCLSWEFLCWEYGKALELWESDPHGLRHYNDVAEKFQTFQVLLIRFLEDEPFQGPRVQHYVKNRCVLRNLLQVPLVRDDNYRDRKKERKVISSKDVITSLQLVEIIEESIRILWKFIRSDHDISNAVLVNCRRSSNIELQTPADANLLAKVRSSLHKKDKRLKELRSENCVVRNLRRHQQEDGTDEVLYFFSRVDMKLVSRVLNMSRISTEQLVWCGDKLNKIKFVGRKLQVEQSVLLFPC